MKCITKLIMLLIFIALVHSNDGNARDCALEIIKPTDKEYVMDISEIKIINKDTSCAWDKIEIYVDKKLVFKPSFMPFDGWWNFGQASGSHEVQAIGYKKKEQPFIVAVHTIPLATTYYREVNLVEAYASVVNNKGSYVHDLKQDDFLILVDDKLASISNFSQENSPLSMVLLMDISTTMTGYIEKSRMAAIDFIHKLMKTEDHVAVVSFNDRITLAHSFSGERNQIIGSLLSLHAGGGTSLYDAILYGLNLLQPIKGRRAIIIFSDGKDETSVLSLQTALEAIRGREPTIFAIGFGQALDNQTLQSFLERIATSSGGTAYFTRDVKELDRIYDKIAMRIRAQYLLAFLGSQVNKDGKWHTIAVKVKNQNYKVYTREGFYAN